MSATGPIVIKKVNVNFIIIVFIFSRYEQRLIRPNAVKSPSLINFLYFNTDFQHVCKLRPPCLNTH